MFIVADWEAEESPYADFINAVDKGEIELTYTFVPEESDISEDGWYDRLYYEVTPAPEGVDSLSITIENAFDLYNGKELYYVRPDVVYCAAVVFSGGEIKYAYSNDKCCHDQHELIDLIFEETPSFKEGDALLERLNNTFLQRRAKRKESKVIEMMKKYGCVYEQACEEWEQENEIIDFDDWSHSDPHYKY